MATYNRDSSLCEAMRSVFSQDYPGEVELIVVDQSKDHNEEVRKFFRAHREDFRYIFQSEPNLPAARNAAFSAAKGDLIFFIDDDMVLPSDAISRLAKHFSPFRLQVVSGVIVSEKNPELSLRQYARRHGIDVTRQIRPKKVTRSIGTARFLSAGAVRAVGGFDELLGGLTPAAYGEDDDFLQRLRSAKIPLFIDPTVRIIHKDHLAGGCASRWTDLETARRYHMKSAAYISAKHHGRVGVRGWMRLARGYVLNRETLSRGLRHVRRCFAEAREAAGEAEAFIAANRR
jgi:glycosyltransferase involved in cell wall biosynthesis